jgi:phosphoglycolate phosphatase
MPDTARLPVLFDLDGTLWDTTEPVAAAWNEALRRADMPDRVITRADIASIMGLTHEQIFPRLFPDLEPTRREALSALCYEEEERFLSQRGGTLYGGVTEGLRRLAATRPLAIVSNCQKGYIELFVATCQFEGLFVDWECHGNTGAGKGDNITRVMRRQEWDEAFYVGDTVGDESAASQAGCRFLFAAYGFGQASPAAQPLPSFKAVVQALEAPTLRGAVS